MKRIEVKKRKTMCDIYRSREWSSYNGFKVEVNQSLVNIYFVTRFLHYSVTVRIITIYAVFSTLFFTSLFY